ncbi:NAD-dependent epimerase/dehydratase family protein [Rhizobium skierniewicense]|uniref:NAD-dependent epimerase/dehydratase family protein n=1 Tax=Rhizobium skierniewicense TaxID=984260 RepID=UPI0015737934|nr:NAD-dependent epimerase/dehydratase family protein [Rhizobium skierniewicense]NTF33485.1 NAD-dependent epimerase/dehydratase family protein [Rhizobium skierniewicense]
MFLVTGATGFVGTSMINTLRQRDLPFRAASRSACEDFIRVGDIDASTDWQAALSGVDTVIHLAAHNQDIMADDQGSDDKMRSVNVDGTVRLAQQSVECGVRRFVFISTIKVNGERSEPGRPFNAHDRPAPETAYGRSKLQAENRLMEIANASGMELVIVRPPLVYGKAAKGSFKALVKLVKSGLPLPLRSVRNRRSVIHVDNLADLIITAAMAPSAHGHILMAADGVALSTADFIRKIASASGRRAVLLPVPASLLQTIGRVAGKRDMVARLIDSLEADITETEDRLSWKPPFSTDEGLRRSV